MNDLQTENRKVVMGLGNLLLGDEGFGIHALQEIQQRLENRASVEWVDGGVLGLSLLPLVEECSHLLVLDVIDAGMDPGRMVELPKAQIPLYAAMKLSEHQLSFEEVLGLAQVREKLPEHLHILGIQPASLDFGVEISPQARQSLPQVIQRAQDILQEWRLLDLTE